MEHHSGIVPWQMICEEKGAVLKVIPVSPEGALLMDEYERLLRPRTKMVSVVHVSNTLGTINPISKITDLAHPAGARVLIAAAQSFALLPVAVSGFACDFLVFSANKIYGLTGVGILFVKLTGMR